MIGKCGKFGGFGVGSFDIFMATTPTSHVLWMTMGLLSFIPSSSLPGPRKRSD